MSRVKVSVVIPTFNGQRYIAEMLESILNQTKQIDELVVSDDASTDRTVYLIENIVRNYPHLNFVLLRNKENIGLKKNIVQAIRSSTCELILLADQDDIWEFNKVEVFSKIYECGHHYIISDMRVINEVSEILPFTWSEYCLKRFNVHKDLISNGCSIGVSSTFINACLPIPFVKAHDVWLSYCARKLKIRYFVDITLMRYRFNSKGISSVHHFNELNSALGSDNLSLIERNYDRKIKFKKNIKSIRYYQYLFGRLVTLIYFFKVKLFWKIYHLEKSKI